MITVLHHLLHIYIYIHTCKYYTGKTPKVLVYKAMQDFYHQQHGSTRPATLNAPVFRTLWSQLDGICGTLQGSWGVLEDPWFLYATINSKARSRDP